jgi:uncharacterized protein
MRISQTLFGTALATALLAGCGSSPALRYYSLDVATPSGNPTHPLHATLIHVRHISLPPEIDHRGLTHRQGGTQFAISDSDEWSAPLSELLQGTITRDLGVRLGYDHVLAPAAQPVAARPDLTNAVDLDLDFVALEADDSCGVTAQVNWTLSVPNGATRRGTAHLAAPGASCPAGLPAGLSAALGSLADQLAEELTTF